MANELIKVFNFEDNNVTFYDKNGMLYINATEMAKPFGENKRPSFWLRSQSTSEFLQELTDVRKCTSADLQVVVKGGINQGTWFHKDVAIEFARWLSPKFAIWCNDKIEELITKGHTSAQNFDVPTTFSAALKLAAEQAEQLEEKERQLKQAAQTIHSQEKCIASLEKDKTYLDQILHNHALVSSSSVAQDYGLSAKGFNELLRKWGVQYKCGDQWILKSRYKDAGYVSSETITINSTKRHSVKVVVHTKWTQKGRRFIYDLFKMKGIQPIIERLKNDLPE